MNSRCASTLFVVALSVIIVVYGAPTDALNALQLSSALLGNNLNASVGSVGDGGLQCYCTTSEDEAKDGTYDDCPTFPYTVDVCVTMHLDTDEYGDITSRVGMPTGFRSSCGKTVKNVDVTDDFGGNVHVKEGSIQCCYTDHCNSGISLGHSLILVCLMLCISLFKK